MVYGFSLILLNAEKKINPDVSWVYDLCLTMWGKKERKDFFFIGQFITGYNCQYAQGYSCLCYQRCLCKAAYLFEILIRISTT